MRAQGERFLTLVTLESKQAGLSPAWKLGPYARCPCACDNRVACDVWYSCFDRIWPGSRPRERERHIGPAAHAPGYLGGKRRRGPRQFAQARPTQTRNRGKIIDQHEGKFDPSTFKDRYEDAVRDLIARKKKG